MAQAKRIERKEQGAITEEAVQPMRNSLSALAVHGKQRPVASTISSGLKRPKRKAFTCSDKENAGGLDIFVDEEFKPGTAGTKATQAAPGAWNKLGTFEQNR